MKKIILITGVYGFLGGALWRFLEGKEADAEVYGVDIKAGFSHKRVIACDLLNATNLTNVLSTVRPDYIFHLAGGRVSDGQLFQVNVQATQALFETMAKLKDIRPRLIIPGSAAEYGEINCDQERLKEAVLPQPVSWYGFYKYMQTNLSLLYARKGFDVVVARMFNISGSGVPAVFSLGRFSKEITLIEKGAKKNVIQTGYLGDKRDFLDINDVCSALSALAQKGASGEIYNVCSGRAHTMRELLEKLLKCSTVKNISIEETADDSFPRYDSVGSNEKIKKMTSWRPEVKIEQSLEDTLNHYRTLLK